MHWLRPSYALSQLFRRDPFHSAAFCQGPFAAPLSVYSLYRRGDDSNNSQQKQQQQQQSAASSSPVQQTQVQDSRSDGWLERRRRHRQRLHNHLRFHHDPLSLFDSISPFSSPLSSLFAQPAPPFWPGFGRAAPEMTVDFFSTASSYSVHAAIPGIDKRDIKVTVEDGVLKIEAERREERKERSPAAATSSTSLPVNGQQTTAAQAAPQQGSTPETSDASAGSAASTAAADSSAGEKSADAESGDDSVDYHHVESYYGRVERSVALPEDADAERLTARYENGVVKIDIPRLAQQKKQPRRIDIQ